jgi:regulator of protease activity HflC (stomatin/prohibitin superfamily)
VRITRDYDLPLHFEASPLKATVKVVGWMVGVLAIVAGMAGFVRAESAVAEAAAVCLILIGGTLVVALIRCRCYEVTVGERRIELRLGPFRRTLPSGCVENATARPASAWRRLFAPGELVLTLGLETRPVIVPTNDPEELRTALVGNSASDQ